MCCVQLRMTRHKLIAHTTRYSALAALVTLLMRCFLVKSKMKLFFRVSGRANSNQDGFNFKVRTRGARRGHVPMDVDRVEIAII